MSSSKQYQVKWECDVVADSPREAVESAWEMLLEPGAECNAFDVKLAGEPDDSYEFHDLGEDE